MFEQAEKLVKSAKNIYIVGHKNPDGDSIGAAFAMCIALRQMGKKANVLISKYSNGFDIFPETSKKCENVKEEKYDLLITVDSSDKERLDISEKDIEKAEKILMIDHHKMSNPFGDVNCIEEDSPAASQIVYEFLEFMNISVGQDIAKYLYMGIMTDTGSFNYSSTTPKTLEIASKLVATGIDFSYICDKLNHTIPEAKLYLIAKTVEKMEEYFNGQVRYSYIDYNTINELGIDEEDAEGMTNYLKMVEGTKVGVYVREKSNGTYKVSMRSDESVDISEIAIKFGGGGHKRAAGYTIIEKLDDAKKRLLETLEEALKK